MVVGVVIVTYEAEDVIARCLGSLMSSVGADLRVILVDNASRDATIENARRWAAGSVQVESVEGIFRAAAPRRFDVVESTSEIPPLSHGEIGLIRSPENIGFAAGVNLGIKSFLAMPDVEAVWILNPDCIVENATAKNLVEKARQAGSFGVIGGRIYYDSPQFMIQSDGGKINLWTGTCRPFNMTRVGRDVPGPVESDLDYIPGTHMLVSREFIDRAGLMPERYFLYYEEMEWCLRRGELPLLFCVEAPVHHIGGHAAGSATINNGPSPLSAYFMTRSRIRFVAKMNPAAIPVAVAYAFAKAVRCFGRRQIATGTAMIRGLSGMGPTEETLKIIGRSRLPG